MLKRLLLTLAFASALAFPATAQRVQFPPPAGVMAIACGYNSSPPTLQTGWYGLVQCNSQGALSVNASVSASISGWPGATQTTGTPISVTTGGVTGSLPAGSVVLATNDGATNTAYCALGASATVNDVPIYPHSSVAFTISGQTQMTCITSTSTTSVKMSGGAGLPTGWGGGSASGGGGGGAITAASGSYAGGAFSAGAAVDGWNLTDGLTTSTPCILPATGTACVNNALLKAIANAANSAIPAQSTHTVNIGAVDSINQYPATAVPYTATAIGTTAATTATLAGASSVTTYLCGFSIRSNATAAITGNATVTGVITATLNYNHWTAPVASGIGITEQVFNPCIPASGTNQSIAVVSPAPGTGGVVSVTAWGYKL